MAPPPNKVEAGLLIISNCLNPTAVFQALQGRWQSCQNWQTHLLAIGYNGHRGLVF